MSRLNHVELTEASGEARELLNAVNEQFGMVPNFLKVFANSPSTLAAFLGLNTNLHRGALDGKTRERIALAMAEGNGCQYCVSAHTALGKQAGLDESEIRAAREGGSADAKADAAVKFAQAILDNKGDITTGELNAVREAGYDDGEIVEIIGHIGLNVLTNFFAKAARIDIDFPEVQLLATAEA
jgi:uncharacterized peroxidase-related enzyme